MGEDESAEAARGASYGEGVDMNVMFIEAAVGLPATEWRFFETRVQREGLSRYSVVEVVTFDGRRKTWAAKGKKKVAGLVPSLQWINDNDFVATQVPDGIRFERAAPPSNRSAFGRSSLWIIRKSMRSWISSRRSLSRAFGSGVSSSHAEVGVLVGSSRPTFKLGPMRLFSPCTIGPRLRWSRYHGCLRRTHPCRDRRSPYPRPDRRR